MRKISDSHEIGQETVEQMANMSKKAGGKFVRRATSRALKFMKRLLASFMERLIVSILKAFAVFVGPIGCLAILVILLLLTILSSIPFADWFLEGGTRSEAQVEADKEYERRFIELADESVKEIDGIEADEEWKTAIKNEVKPSWGIPAALTKYQIIKADQKIDLPDPEDLFAGLKPSFLYKTISDDYEYFMVEETCTYTTEATEDKPVQTYTTTSTSFFSNRLSEHEILTEVVTPYGHLEIPSLKRYYPGGYTDGFHSWEYYDSSSDGDCSSVTYRQWERTQVDDRGVPALEIDSQKLKTILIDKGVLEEDIPLVFEFAKTADPSFIPQLFDGYRYSGIYGSFRYENVTYTYSGPVIDGWVWPVAGYYNITSNFGPRNGEFHFGVDIGGAPSEGAPVLAALDGVVIWSNWSDSYGNWAIIAHDNGLQTRYAHMKYVTVRKGDQVRAGDQIGVVGSTGRSTGPHLHFEVLRPGRVSPYEQSKNMEQAYDPMIFLEKLIGVY